MGKSKRKKAAEAANAASLKSRQAKKTTEEEKTKRYNAFVDKLRHVDKHIDELRNPRGRVRTAAENKMVILIFRCALEDMMAECEEEEDPYCTSLSLNKVYMHLHVPNNRKFL